MAEQPDKTTLADRLSTGAVQAGLWGGVSLLFSPLVNGIVHKAFKQPGKIKWFTKMDWQIAGISAAIAGAIAFFTANGPQERKVSKAIEDTINYANDPNNHFSEKQREQMIEHAMNEVQNGKIPEVPSSTKHRDRVSAQRSNASQSQQIGA
jgi:hypothetical protein